MITCTEMTPEMLPNRVSVYGESDIGFQKAREIAQKEIYKHMLDPMLLGWYERSSGAFSPRVECCSETKPGWVVYAETRGGSLTVDVNDGDYFFIYGEFHEAAP
jgi:hypothetical protein